MYMCNRWFSRGALDIYQCFIVNVTNCVFEDNGFVGVTKFGYQYRGHAGGLSVGKYTSSVDWVLSCNILCSLLIALFNCLYPSK